MSQPIPSIAEIIIHTTVQIIITDKEGKSYGGTGFIVDYLKDGAHLPMLVTNKHVVEDAITGSLTFLQKENGKPMFGRTHTTTFDNFESLWYPHPEPDIDITVLPIGFAINQLGSEGKEIYYTAIDLRTFPTTDQINELDVIEEIIFIGYPKNLIDPVNLSPIVRRGITATSIHLDYNNEPIFLIDAPVYEGSSGSPVFIYNRGWISQKMGGVKMGSRLHLLGIVAESFYYFEKGKVEKEKVSQKTQNIAKVKTFFGIGIVYKFNKIMEALDNCYSQLKSQLKKD